MIAVAAVGAREKGWSAGDQRGEVVRTPDDRKQGCRHRPPPPVPLQTVRHRNATAARRADSGAQDETPRPGRPTGPAEGSLAVRAVPPAGQLRSSLPPPCSEVHPNPHPRAKGPLQGTGSYG